MHWELDLGVHYVSGMPLYLPTTWCNLLSCMKMHEKGPIILIEVVTFLVDHVLNVDFLDIIEVKSGILEWCGTC
jgi:hypothetical protein